MSTIIVITPNPNPPPPPPPDKPQRVGDGDELLARLARIEAKLDELLGR